MTMLRIRLRLLSHPEDIHCIVFHVLVLVSYAMAFWLYLHPETAGIDGPWSRLAFILACIIMIGWIAGIDVGVNFHNHVHRRIFRSVWLNRWFGRLWTVSGGWPSFFWKHAHVTVHHKYVLGARDWTLPRRLANGETESYWSYCLSHWPWRYVGPLWRDFRSGGARLRRQALGELAIFLALWSIPFWIDPVMALVLWVPPQFFGNALILGPGMWVQHDRCRPPTEEHPYRHSNSFLSRFFNLIMFNIGYHAEHHNAPQVHWSELPEFHERSRTRFHPDDAHLFPFGYYRASAYASQRQDWVSTQRGKEATGEIGIIE